MARTKGKKPPGTMQQRQREKLKRQRALTKASKTTSRDPLTNRTSRARIKGARSQAGSQGSSSTNQGGSRARIRGTRVRGAITGSKTPPALPPKGGSSAKPPRQLRGPSDGRPKPNRRSRAQTRAQQAARGSRTPTVRTGNPGKGPGMGYGSDIKAAGNAIKGVGKQIGKGRNAALAIGTALSAAIARSAGTKGAANMSLLGGNAPTYDTPIQRKKKKK